VQAQDLRAARLALRARSRRLSAVDVDQALDDAELVVGWLGRGTLHLVCRRDYPWLLALTAPPRLATNRRRLAQLGVSTDQAESAVAIIEEALSNEGPRTRPQLGERLSSRGMRTQGQALPHLLMLAALRGVAVLGPVHGGRQAFALTRDWLGASPAELLPEGEPDRTLAELARRYLAGHGPAAPADLARWAGLTLRDARAGLRSMPGELEEIHGGLVDLAARKRSTRPPPPRLLPAYDPYLLGWRDRSFAVADRHAGRVHPGGGVLRPVAIVGGVAVGTWRSRRSKHRLAVDIDAFTTIDARSTAELRSDARDVARFESLEPGP
jgi:hypothetical protein